MKRSFFGPVGAFAAMATLAGCGGSSIPHAPDNAISNAGAPQGSKTFHYIGKEQRFIVPTGVRQLTVVAHGGEGAGLSMYPSTNSPGRPGRVYAIVPVHPGEKLYVFVGASGTHGGFNGGGAGGNGGHGTYKVTGNPGGGASDVRAGGDTLANRIIVAAGGGGAGEAIYEYGYADGGNGGGLGGQAGGGGPSGYGGGGGGAGGSQSAGGSGGAGGLGNYYYPNRNGQPGGHGALGLGGPGGSGNQGPFYRDAAGGGGGGGGYYGGGGGGGSADVYYTNYYADQQSGGGGGGSSYVEPKAITSRMWTGWDKAKSDDGLIVFSWK